VPIGDWFQEQFDLSRNHYDRFGHFFQGVVPALLARELVVRTTPLKSGKWLFFCCMCVAVAISAFYELFEWQYAMLTNPDAAGTYLGQQGDEWDAQKDILMAFLGSTSFLLLFSGLQDRQIRAIEAETPSRTPAQT
jgi:putative membrane protein